jgi:O-antigen/teichoic acid export membrane protein
MISALLGALQAYLTSAFIAFKKTKTIFISTLIASATNIFVNIILTPLLGIWGAVIANILSYSVVFYINLSVFNKSVFRLDFSLLKLNLSFILLVLISMLIILNVQYMTLLALALLGIVSFMYRTDIINLCRVMTIQLKKISINSIKIG